MADPLWDTLADADMVCVPRRGISGLTQAYLSSPTKLATKWNSSLVAIVVLYKKPLTIPKSGYWLHRLRQSIGTRTLLLKRQPPLAALW